MAQQRVKQRTWSMLGDVKRRPTAYEVVTAKFHYHFRREPAPFELDPEVPLNQWYLRYREGSAFQVDDWEGFRDPAKLTYKDYVGLQHEREVYLDGVVDRAEATEWARTLPDAWIEAGREVVLPLRFALHILQMQALYVGQIAPSSFITNAAHFQAGDEMRRVQRVAYWTKAVSLARGDDDFASTEAARSRFENHEAWQPLRRVLEEMLVAYDWGEAFVALQLAVKPAVDALVEQGVARAAAASGDAMLAGVLEGCAEDGRRARSWARELVGYAVGLKPALGEVIQAHQSRWAEPAIEAAAAVGDLLRGAPGAVSGADVAEAARKLQADVAAAGV